MDRPAERNVDGDPPKREAGGVPRHIRRLAREAADRRGMTVSEFLTEAILAYAERLSDGTASRVDIPPDITGAVERCERKIAMLEARMRALETTGRKDSFFARVRLENLVERPWLRNRGY